LGHICKYCKEERNSGEGRKGDNKSTNKYRKVFKEMNEQGEHMTHERDRKGMCEERGKGIEVRKE
jgi:hypothetical protein